MRRWLARLNPRRMSFPPQSTIIQYVLHPIDRWPFDIYLGNDVTLLILLKLVGSLIVLSASIWETVYKIEEDRRYNHDKHDINDNYRNLLFDLWQWQLIGTFA